METPLDTLTEITKANDAYFIRKKKIEDLKLAQSHMRMWVRRMKRGDSRLGPSIVEIQKGEEVLVRAEGYMVQLYRYRWKLALRYLWEVKHFILAESVLYTLSITTTIGIMKWMLP
jgi:hypothetical protein